MKRKAPKHTVATEARSAMAATGKKVTQFQAEALLAARRRCDEMGDSQDARNQMRRDVLNTPADLLQDLITALMTVRITRTDFLGNPTNPQKKECHQ